MEVVSMRKFGIALIGVAAMLIGAMVAYPAHAAVVPNGSESLSISGLNTVNTGDISSSTTSLTLGSIISVGSFADPFLGNVNNFCAVAGNGCTAPHAPGYLKVGDVVTFSLLTFPVGGGVHSVL